ncbi:MAG: hypothetical protein QME96_15190 [Myxococcota bacterium]|nr:hypothetical protein [Myxococcota bacterium]
MTRSSRVLVVALALMSAASARAEESRTWSSADTFSATEPWWSLELEERLAVGSLQSDIFASSTAADFGIGLTAAYHLDHHWLLGVGTAFDFPLSVGTTASSYAAVDTAVPGFGTTLRARVGYLPLALWWMTLGLAVEAGVFIDSVTVESGGEEAGALAVLGAFSGEVQFSLFPHDAFEIGLRVGYRYLVGERAALGQADADRLHVPAGPYRGAGDMMVVIYEALHF